ncbi:SMP-30/gluconolactonase/LRE family protein [Leifsonia sp. SIMBA_070]|uniref:SMP-30/gluconolactonase/LRE family protein n=1 Tax=Leifsonia sp. SIMBA_070 TaxID=3085810 RepID=UPI00397C863F
MTHDLTLATDEAFFLAEGPLWDPIRSRLLWVDIPSGTVLVGTLRADSTIDIVDRVSVNETAGAVAVAQRGEWLIAGGHRLIVVDPHGGVLPLAPLVDGPRRFNDGKPDPAGRYVVGTLSLEGGSVTEKLLQVDSNGSVRVIDDDLTLSNGLAWTGDGSILYSVDTERRVVFRRGYDVATGETGSRDVFLTFDKGYPDGMTIDSEDHLWIAMWGIGEVRCYSPDGRLVEVVTVPAPHTSSVCFAGPDLATLVITTATQDLDEVQREEFPLSGRLFTIKPGVRGLPQPLWAGMSDPALFQ